MLPVLNPKTYDRARVLEASGRPMLVIGRSYFVSIQVVEEVVQVVEEVVQVVEEVVQVVEVTKKQRNIQTKQQQQMARPWAKPSWPRARPGKKNYLHGRSPPRLQHLG